MKNKFNVFLLMFYDFATIALSYFLALLIRFDFMFSRIETKYLDVYYKLIFPFSVLCIVVYWFFNLYGSLWKYASNKELISIVFASSTCAVLCFITVRMFGARMPSSFHVIGYYLQTFFALFIRFMPRLIYTTKRKKKPGEYTRIMIIGAGTAGLQLIKEINDNDVNNMRVVCVIDDDANKTNRYIDGVKIVGGRNTILENVEKYNIDVIFYAIPSSSNDDKRDILNICKETDCDIKVIPGMYQIVNGEVSVNMLKNVAIEDLLGRDTVAVNNEEIYNYLSNKTILVTGGGGSIGSELCRQIAKHNPKHLIIFDIYENNAYDIQNELKRDFKDLNITVLIGSVRDSKRVDHVFKTYKPDIVYHAAAHKHVPLMEDSPCEAIKNNVFGTFKTAYAATKYGTEKFVLISTDKAVNPTNIMGASKRICEMVIQVFDKAIKDGSIQKLSNVEDCFSEESSNELVNKTEFVAVRFGNVLGSNGSVIPLFKKQIEQGGPVTVTHPDIIRYFMTIPEAVSLVIQAGVYAKGGEIFILDMGEPVKIDTLARNLIRLSGLVPDDDIKIEYTGLRPGEKLYEEKLLSEEGNTKTENDLIYVAKPLEINEDTFVEELKELYRSSNDNDEKKTIDLISEVVETYKREEVR